MPDATGGCLCGAVRYVCTEPPAMMGACHCRDCQRASGSAFATLMIFPRESVRLDGPVATYEHRGDSGKMVRRRFCPTCGVHVAVEYDVTPQFVVVMAGTLDDSTLIHPQWNIYTASKQPWVELSSSMKAFNKGFKRD